jgi:hypothetical protein
MTTAIRLSGALILALFLSACWLAPGKRLSFEPSALSANGLRYADGRLETLDRSPKGPPTDGNRDHLLSFPRPGVMRLETTGQCSLAALDKPGLCFVRAELREVKEARQAFDNRVYYAVAIDLSGTGPGAVNTRKFQGGERLMVAQAKFGLAEDGNRSGVSDFSPVMALRYEDDQLYVTAELLGTHTTPMPETGLCEAGMPAFRASSNRNNPNAPYRALLAMEAGDDPADLPWEFTKEENPAVICLQGVRTAGTRVFPRQPRDRPFDIAMHLDGRLPNDAHVAFYINESFVACAASDIAGKVTGEDQYFKFGLYGDLLPGARFAADYSNFRVGPTAWSVGFRSRGVEGATCRAGVE